MRSLTLACAIAICAGLALAEQPESRPLSPLEQELVTNEKRFLEAWQEKKAAYVSRTVSNDFRGIVQNGDFYNKEELVGTIHEDPPKDFRVYDIRVVRLDSTCAVVACNTIVPGSCPRYRHMSDAWTNESGQWKRRRTWSSLNLD